MVRAIDPNRTHDYIPRADRDLDEHEQTVFELRPFTVGERRWFLDRAATLMDSKAARMGEWEEHVLRTGIAGWRNLLDEDGGEVEFVARPDKSGPCRRPVVSEQLLGRVPPAVRAELVEVIQTRELAAGNLSPDDAGN